MKFNEEEKKALEFFKMKENEEFDREELLKYRKMKEESALLDAFTSDDTFDVIKEKIPIYYDVLEFCLFKKSYYEALKERYLSELILEDGKIYSVDIDTNYLRDEKVLPILMPLLNTHLKRLNNFGDLLVHAKNEEEVKKLFDEFVKKMDNDIDLYKSGKINCRDKLIEDLKNYINSNFEKGSMEYQYMLSHYFTPMMSTKDDTECLMIYNAAIDKIGILLSNRKANSR